MDERRYKTWIIILYVFCFIGFAAQAIISYLEFRLIPATLHKRHYDYTFRHFVLLIMVATPLIIFCVLCIRKLIDTCCLSRLRAGSSEEDETQRKIVRNTFRASAELATCLISVFLFVFALMLIMQLESRKPEISLAQCDEMRVVDQHDDCVTTHEYMYELMGGILCIITSLLFTFAQLHQLYTGKANFLTVMNPRYPDIEAQKEHNRRLSLISNGNGIGND